MKKIVIISGLAVILSIGSLQAQTPPGPGSSSTENSFPAKGGASLGGGLLIMLSLGVGYTLRKIHDFRKLNRELKE